MSGACVCIFHISVSLVKTLFYLLVSETNSTTDMAFVGGAQSKAKPVFQYLANTHLCVFTVDGMPN